MQFEYYSQRQLNPLRGIVNIVKYQSAEAVSTDGLVWKIIDNSAINTARVKALFRHNEVQAAEEEEKILSIFYLELYPISAE